MGIIVTEGVLPSEIPINNVYISFAHECITIFPKNSEGLYTIQTCYKIHKDETKQPNSDIRIPISIQVSDIAVSVYNSLYENLKQIYPDSVDC